MGSWNDANRQSESGSSRAHVRWVAALQGILDSQQFNPPLLYQADLGIERKIERMKDSNRRLMFHGMCLFLLGLLTGFGEQHFANVRMGLAAHLEGVMNGIFLLALGAAWAHVRLPARAAIIAFWTVLYGAYVNWLVTVLAAIFGTGALSPITAGGHNGQPWQETFVTVGFMSVGIAMVIASALIIWGLRREGSQ